MKPLFTVSSTVPVFKRRGAEFKDVVINWFVTDRESPAVNPLEWIDFATASDPVYSIHALNELFTTDEAEQLKDYLMNVHGDDSVKIEPAGKLHENILPWNAIAVGGPRDFLMLTTDDYYNLPFKVDGYFDVEQHQRLPAKTPTPPPATPKAPQSPPWRKAPDSVIPDEVQQPGMEKHRFQLLDYRLNGFESRLREIDNQYDGELDRLTRYTVGLEKRLVAIHARLELLETAGVGTQRDNDSCRVCGANRQATHAPWCEYRDGSPVAESDRMRLFSDWTEKRIADNTADTVNHYEGLISGLQNQLDADRAAIWKLQEQIDALQAKQPLNPA